MNSSSLGAPIGPGGATIRAMARAPKATTSGGHALPALPPTDPVLAARVAALRYVSDDRPGIRRRKSGTGFSYADPDGRTIRDRATLRRIRALAIPPAWTDVWIAPLEDGHLQATGRDARRRKQYRYHVRWREVRDQTKYGRMLLFGAALPGIRTRVDADLALPGMPRDKVLALVVRLLETTFIRVGNEEYARENNSFGLTTLLDRHVRIDGADIQFRFRGKGGKMHAIRVNDRRLARLIRHTRDLPGEDLFQYIDGDGTPQPITSSDVNDYIRAISNGEEFTAKDFRTWGGTLLAAVQLEASHPFESETSPKATQTAAVISVAARLGNTPTICRKCYIHPIVLAAYQDRAQYDLWAKEARSRKKTAGLTPEEGALLRYLVSGDRRRRGRPIVAAAS